MNFQLRSLWVAFGFLTRVPVGDPSRGGTKPVRMAAAVPWFPIVGFCIGMIQAGVWLGMLEFSTPLTSAAVSTAAAALLTGAFHHDGLADMADAFGGGWTVEQRMEILKDSRLGTYGTASLCLAYLIEVAALSSFDARAGAVALVVMHVFGRGVAVAAMLFAPIAADGLGASYTSDLRPFTASIALVFAAGVAVAGLGQMAFVSIPVSLLAGAVVVALAIRKIGGVTGDVLGAITVVSGLALLVTAV